MIEEFFTWETLMKLPALVIATCGVTSFIKELPLIKRIPTQVISWITAFILLSIATIVTSGGILPWHGWILAGLNSMMISLGSNGMYSMCIRGKNKEEG